MSLRHYDPDDPQAEPVFGGFVLEAVSKHMGGSKYAEKEWGGQDVKGALKAATGSFIGFILGTGIKTIVFVLILISIKASLDCHTVSSIFVFFHQLPRQIYKFFFRHVFVTSGAL